VKSVTVELQNNNEILVCGKINFDTVESALIKAKQLFHQQEHISINLRGVQGKDSASLAFIAALSKFFY